MASPVFLFSPLFIQKLTVNALKKQSEVLKMCGSAHLAFCVINYVMKCPPLQVFFVTEFFMVTILHLKAAKRRLFEKVSLKHWSSV